MSIQVELSDLAVTVARYRFAYLLTVSDESLPHALAVTPAVDGDALTVDGIGRHTQNNLLARPGVTLVWPPESVDEYSLIVDGQAAASGEKSVRITPIRAVLHRPAPRPGPVAEGACGSDCVELPLRTEPSSG
ncbi:MAG: hypothetical protein L0H63_01740 [Nitrococcus sp.]|nr:hypothetical protein [Nitrococcus sp.]